MTESTTDESDPYVFERRLRGMLPGLDHQFKEKTSVESFLAGKNYGGIIAGIPTLKIDDERQHFSMPAVLRGMHGESYALMLVSRPVSGAQLGKQLHAVWGVRDKCHETARSARQSQKGHSGHHNDSGLT